MGIFSDVIWVIIFILLFVVFLMVCALIECFYRVYQARKHRRQHNIFEVGDKVVSIDKYSNDMIFTVAELTSKNVFTSMEFGEIAYSFVRHATPEEIKAGRRL